MSNRRKPTMSAHDRPSAVSIDPHLAVDLSGTGRRANAQQIARNLLRENAELLKVLGALLERTGPVELDVDLLADAGVLYEVERYDSTDGLTVRFVGKRVAGG